MVSAKNINIGIFVLLIAIAGALVASRTSTEDPAASSSEEQVSAPVADQSTTLDQETSTPVGEAPVNVESITLEAKNGYDASGEATRSYSEKTFNHEVVAEMGPPAEGKFYEGWLVGTEGFISTGALESEDETTWSLVFSSETDERRRNQVVITEETQANGLDNIPETHVLEGEFIN